MKKSWSLAFVLALALAPPCQCNNAQKMEDYLNRIRPPARDYALNREQQMNREPRRQLRQG